MHAMHVGGPLSVPRSRSGCFGYAGGRMPARLSVRSYVGWALAQQRLKI